MGVNPISSGKLPVDREDFEIMTENEELFEGIYNKNFISLETILDHYCGDLTEQYNEKTSLSNEQINYLKSKNIFIKEQQTISVPKGKNSPRLNLSKKDISSDRLKKDQRYVVVFIPQPIRINVYKKHKKIRKKYEKIEEKNLSIEQFVENLSICEIESFLDWKIDEMKIRANHEPGITWNESETGSDTGIERINKKIDYIDSLFCGEKSLTRLGFKMFAELIYKRTRHNH